MVPRLLWEAYLEHWIVVARCDSCLLNAVLSHEGSSFQLNRFRLVGTLPTSCLRTSDTEKHSFEPTTILH